MFRKSKKYAALCARMRAAKEALRLASIPPDYPPPLPNLRRRLIVEDYDTGTIIRHEFLLYKTDRIDCYRVEVDGSPWKPRIGFSAVLAGLRLALPRRRSLK